MAQEYIAFSGGDSEATEFYISRYGNNLAVGTTPTFITQNGVYRTPQFSGATTLRIKAGGNANDTVAGTGAREITVVGLDQNGDLVSDVLVTNGASASAVTNKQFTRLWRCFVSRSGTYASGTTFSHAGIITIENGSGGTDWAQIGSASALFSNAEIGCFTIPRGFTGYFKRFGFATDSAKKTNIHVFRRGAIQTSSAPHMAAIRVYGVFNSSGNDSRDFSNVPFIFPELTDVLVYASVDAGTATVEVQLDFVIVKN